MVQILHVNISDYALSCLNYLSYTTKMYEWRSNNYNFNVVKILLEVIHKLDNTIQIDICAKSVSLRINALLAYGNFFLHFRFKGE